MLQSIFNSTRLRAALWQIGMYALTVVLSIGASYLEVWKPTNVPEVLVVIGSVSTLLNQISKGITNHLKEQGALGGKKVCSDMLE